MELNERQEKILDIVKSQGPITGENIAEILEVTRAALRPDLAVLTMSGYLEAKPRVGYTYKADGFNTKIKKILNQYRVKDIMSLPVVVKEKCSIYDAIVTLFLEDIGSIFVVEDDNCLTGLASRKDLLKATMGQVDIHKVPVSVIMTRMPNVITADIEDTVVEAVKRLVEHEVDSLPVVRRITGGSGKESLEVVGRITKTNITRLFLDLALR
ncbi:MAG: helix-turn-helix transcriptional regulator [Syntrophomonadaceae bacterium]